LFARVLFVASAAFVLWRTTQVGVLVDISWIVNNATRIALGDVPYRDFPLAQMPGEFLVQALLIKLFGARYTVQIFYVVICGGAATALAYLIARRLLASLPSAGALAAVVTLPLIPLGVYAIFPDPFYDPDACLAVLGALALLLLARGRPSALRFFAAGAVATVPLAFKQNIGGAFLVSLIGMLALEAWADPVRRRELRWFGTGTLAALVTGALLTQLFIGLDVFLRDTIGFALSGRGLSSERLASFAAPAVLGVAAAVAALAALSSRTSEPRRTILASAAVALLGASLLPAILSLDPPLLFPPLLLTASALAIARATRAGPRLELLMPVVVLGTALGTIESEGLAASTYGIFPLLTLAIACLVRDVGALILRPARLAPYVGAAIALAAVATGTLYTVENVRLRFIDANTPGAVTSAAFPTLTGLSARGPYVGELDAILFWMRDNVPPEDGFVFLPGEDPAYFALQRRPVLPTVFFYFGDIATPYTPAELARIADEVGLRWVIVKGRLQQTATPRQLDIASRLTDHATLVAEVGPYRVFRR
jgi:hypothetical protein